MYMTNMMSVIEMPRNKVQIFCFLYNTNL